MALTGGKQSYIQLLVAAMAREGIIQRQLALKSGISAGQLSHMLGGAQNPQTVTPNVTQRLAHTLDLPMAQLLEAAGWDLYTGTRMGAEEIVQFATMSQLGFGSLAALPPEERRKMLSQMLEIS